MFQVKICGITTAEGALAAFHAGADAIGLNFYPQSRRFLDPRRAATVTDALPNDVAKVGVFVNAPPSEVRQIARDLRLDFVQLHGDEPPETIAELADLAVIRAFRLADDGWKPCREYLNRCERLNAKPQAILIDAFHDGQYGGTGHSPDWSIVRRYREFDIDVPLVLAGGLRPENVAEAIHTAQPDAVDTASGVESAPGTKDSGKVTAFVAAALRAFDTRLPMTNDERMTK
ncbi:MAG: phosphoribosylanthranilate isomerase, partial [Pirellulales bacterium]